MTGVLGLQGDFEAHCRMLEELGSAAQVIKKPAQLQSVDRLVIPGGESTTLTKLMDAYGFWEPLQAFAAEGKAILGTCAGMILVAREVLNPTQKSLDLIDVTVERNGYGRQRESFEAAGTFSLNGSAANLHMIFIRAPRICRMGPEVAEVASYGDECVMARQGRILVASFHPELTDDTRVHDYFLQL